MKTFYVIEMCSRYDYCRCGWNSISFSFLSWMYKNTPWAAIVKSMNTKNAFFTISAFFPCQSLQLHTYFMRMCVDKNHKHRWKIMDWHSIIQHVMSERGGRERRFWLKKWKNYFFYECNCRGVCYNFSDFPIFRDLITFKSNLWAWFLSNLSFRAWNRATVHAVRFFIRKISQKIAMIKKSMCLTVRKNSNFCFFLCKKYSNFSTKNNVFEIDSSL